MLELPVDNICKSLFCPINLFEMVFQSCILFAASQIGTRLVIIVIIVAYRDNPVRL
jgi:hypothetical protein